MADILDRLDELHGKATPGEWLNMHGVALCECNGEDGQSFPDVNIPDLEGNAEWICAAHNHYPTLAARLRAAEADNAALRARVKALEGALRRYGTHENDCRTILYYKNSCDCGFSAALTPPTEEEGK